MKRICIYCETWSSGGIESFIYKAITHMNLEQTAVDIVAARAEKSVFTEKLRNCGVCFFELSGDRNHMTKNRALFLCIAKERHYDAIHVNAFHGGAFYYLYLAKKLGIPVRIAHGHCAGLKGGRYSWAKRVIHDFAKGMFTRYATELWACSRTAAIFMYPKDRCGQNSCRIVLNGVDIDKFQFQMEQRSAAREKMGLDGQLVVGTVGRLCGEKNQTFLLNVFAETVKLCPNSRLLLVGEGPEHERLMQRTRELGIEQDVIFYGTTDHVEQLLWAMDVFVFPSLIEGLGLAAIEAQAAGLPVLCSDVIPEEAHVLPAMKSMSLEKPPEEWAKAVLSLRGRSGCRESCATILRERGFDISDIAAQIMAAYQNNAGTVRE